MRSPLYRRFVVAGLLCILAIMALGATALAAPTATGPATWSAYTPADGTTVGVVRPPIAATATDSRGIAGSPYYSLKVDGGAQSATFTRISTTQVKLSFTPRADQANGPHTVYMSVKNNAGVYSTTTWTYTVSNAPKPSAPAPAPGSTSATNGPVISVAVSGATTGLTSSVVLDGVTIPSSYSAVTGLVTAPTSKIANDASHDVTVTVTNASGQSDKLAWSFSVQIYAAMAVPAADCVQCHPGFPDAHPMDNCLACHGLTGPVGEGWNTPDYGPHPASYIARTPTSCIDCHTGGYATVPAMHGFTPVATYHDSTTACSPCHVKSLTTEHNRYGKTCLSCHGSSNPLVQTAIATGRTDCEACHPGAAEHQAVHVTTVMASCTGAGCHAGTNLTGVGGIHSGTCNSCHKSTDPRVVAAIAGGVKTCDACHDTAGHEARHTTTVPTTCAGSGCHAGTSLTSLHINADGKYTCATCHSSTDSKVKAAIAAGDKSCSACHTTDGVDYHAAASARHLSVTNSGCFGVGCHPASKSLADVHALYAGPGSPNPQFATTCALCHANPAINVKTSGSACTGTCHTSNHTGMNAGHAVTAASAGCTAAGCHASDINTVHGTYSDLTKCATCHSKLGNWSKTGDCINCHAATKAAEHEAAHAVTRTDSCKDCHSGASLTSVHIYAGSTLTCATCHSSTDSKVTAAIAAGDKSCSACHTADGVDFHAAATTKHVSATNSGCFGAGCHPASKSLADVHALYAGPGSQNPQFATACALCHRNPAVNVKTSGTACTGTCHTSNHTGMNAGHAVTSSSAACTSCHGSDINSVHGTYSDLTKCALCHNRVDNWSKTGDCANCHSGDGTAFHAAKDAKHVLPATPSCVSAGCHDSGSTAVFQGKTVDQIHSAASTTTAGGTTRSSCQICHYGGSTPTTNCGTAGCHPDRLLAHGYDAAKHVAAPASNDISILGTTYQLDCVTCHATLELGPLHMAPAGTATCSSCHAALVKQLSTAPETGWKKGCVQAGCHASNGAKPMHPTIDADHTRATGGASDGCFAEGCHAGGTSLAAIHAPKQGCATCHGAGKTPTANCAASGCHDMGAPHANLAGVHANADGSDTLGATHGDSVGMSCSECHSTQLMPLHANYCAVCHSPTASATVKAAVANNDTRCTTCHPSQHVGNDHSDLYNQGDMSCGPCHGSGCTQCHGAWTPVPTPVTTSDAKATYISDAVINLTATDNVNGTFGIKATYYTLDGAATATATQVTVPAPPSGSQAHTLKFWSTDWSGKTEVANTALFTVSADIFPPTTTSNVVAAKTYAGDQTFTLSATDANSSVAGTWWQLDSTSTAGWTSGTSVPVAGPASGTVAHTLYFYSRDAKGNTETTKSASFSSTAGKDFAYTGADQTFVVPSGVTTIAVTMNGGSGGTSSYYGSTVYALGGGGGRVSTVIPVTAGTTLTVKVGNVGTDGNGLSGYAGGWPTGGNGRYNFGSGGGGSSSLWLAASELAEAGGGGGAGNSATYGVGGAGGAQGAAGGGFKTGTTATLGSAGGGGGGWNAGVAGSTTSRGGTGGTSYVVSGSGTVLTAGANTGAGSVAIRYTGPKPGPFTLTYAAGANGAVTGTSPQTVVRGASGSAVSAVANTGYHFVNWSDGSTANPRTDTNVTDDKSVTATFAITTYTLTYTAGTGGTITGTSPQTVNHNASGTAVTAVANTGYHFVSWSDGTTTAARTDSNVLADKSLTATFAINTYSLTYAAGANGTLTGTSLQTVNYNAAGSTVTAVPNTGYHFVSWSDGVATAARTDSNVTADKNVTASFAIDVYYTLTYTAGMGGSITGTSPQTVLSGANGTAVTAVAGTGYYFTGWSDGVSTTTRFETNVAANKSVTANFAVDTGGTTTTTMLQANGTAWMDADWDASSPFGWWDIYADGKLIGTKSADDGLSTWNCPETAVTSGARIDIVQNVSFGSYSSIYDSNSSITYTTYLPPGTTRLEAATWTGFTSTRSDYGYDGYEWGYPAGEYHYVALDAATIDNIKYHTTLNGYTLNYVAGTGGTISGKTPQTVVEGQSGTAVTAVPNSTYHFVNWSDGVTTTTRTETNVTANKTLTANFAANVYYTLTYTAGTGGTISGTNPQTILSGANGTAVTAAPSTGYHFVSWSDGVTTAARTDTTVTANKSVSASFAINSYTVTYTAGAGGTISGTTPQTVTHGGSATSVTAVPTSGQQFVKWSDGVTTATRTDTDITADKAVSATFTAPYTKGSVVPATGAARYLVVPAGVTAMTVDLYGAQGCPPGTTGQIGGKGGYLKANIAVTPGQLLALKVGKTTSGPAGGFGGGSGGGGTYSGGGGSTSVGSTTTVLAEAGGGGAAGMGNGGDGGAWSTVTTGGNQTAASGQWCGGGGGWIAGSSSKYGGGGGASRTSLGSYITCTVGANANDGYMTITWTDPVTYTLTYTAGANGTISGTSPQTVGSGGSGTAVTAVPSTGYHFFNWSDGSTANPRTDTNVTANKSVTASFAINTYTLTYTAGTGGKITGTTPQTVNHNSSGSAVTATANAGYHFLSWSDGIATATRTDANVTANKSVTANFAADPDTTPPTTTSNAVASYAGTATIALTATDNSGGTGVAGTWYQIDTGAWTPGTSIVVSPPPTGSDPHTVRWYSKDVAGNQETTRSASFTVAPAGATATVAFRWEPNYGDNWAYLRVLDESNNVIDQTYVSGSGSSLNWYLTVPAGHMYHLDAYDWYDWDADLESSSYQDTTVLTPGQVWEFWY